MRPFKSIMAACLLLVVISGCQSSSRPGDETKNVITVSGTKPTLEPLEGYPWELSKDNVTVTIAPEPIEAICVYQRSLKKKVELFKASGAEDLYKVTDQPSRLELQPDHLIFRLNVTNNLSHVLRFNGAVPTLTVDGKSIPIDADTQNELLRAVLTPYTTLDMSIAGPKLSAIESASTITFAIYDVITAVDEANNPTKRTTFEWIFSVRPESVAKTLPPRVTDQRFSVGEANRQNNSFVR